MPPCKPSYHYCDCQNTLARVLVFQANLALHEGSGYFFVNTSVKGVSNVEFQEAKRTVQVRRNGPSDELVRLRPPLS